MAMRLLRARLLPDKVRLVVHLDTTEVDADGNPDREWVEVWDWGPTPPQGQTQAQYRATVIAETKALAALELARRRRASVAPQDSPDGTALPNEAEEF